MPPTAMQFDGRLSNVSVQYKNNEYIADLVLPPTPVTKKKGVYKKYKKDERFTLPDTRVGPSSNPNEVNWGLEEGNYECVDYGLEDYVSQEDIDNADAPIMPLNDSAEFVTNLLMLDKEKDVANAAFLAANYAAANQVDLDGDWATLSNDALTDIETGIDACFVRPNVMVMGLPTWRKLSRNEKILAAVKGTLAPQDVKVGGTAVPAVDQTELAKYLGLDHVYVGQARINTAKKGQTASFSRVWDGTNAGKGGAALLRVSPNPTTRDVVSMAHFHWKQRQAFTRDTSRGAFSGKVVRVVESRVIHSVATDVGYLFKDALLT